MLNLLTLKCLTIQQQQTTVQIEQLHTFGVSQLFTYLVLHWFGPHFLPWISQDIGLLSIYRVFAMINMVNFSLD